ncbi:sugar ABC transporter permease [Paenibacillus athensensis]|uniref:ABC transporter permease n=1 Tax=Paenibacillus athensensis TaxID=1967502 RepID=A0A4Y8PZS4_9BACL|nr:sugar ABC transporter permease [Paenibacillus athensensis]MCD1261392.1 sugar ABC transporter permease [Paenibacillus athensensis]
MKTEEALQQPHTITHLHKAAKKNYQYVGFLYIAPWLLGFLILELYPLLASLYYSFTDFSPLKAASFVGLDNYKHMFTDDRDFWNSATVTLKWVIIAVPLKLLAALAVAMLLNRNLKHINFYRALYYLPSIFAGSVAVSILWRFLFMSEGLVNQILAVVHIDPVNWLGDPKYALYTVGLVNMWQFGTSMVLFLAGLKQISPELYEAGKIDGTNVFQKFFSITLPMLTPVILFNLIMQTINAFQDFTTPFTITKGGPAKATYLFSMLIYDNGFRFTKMGYASALSWVLFLVIIILTAIVFKSSRYWAHYEDGDNR